MAQLVVMTFADAEQGEKALASIQVARKAGQLTVEDSAVIVKEADGTARVKNQLDRATGLGALIGGGLGAMLGFMFPLAGIAIGAGGGALVGRSFDRFVDQDFVRDVNDELQPNSSALFVLVSGSEPRALIAALEPFEGHLYQTTVSSELEQQLRDALK